MENVYNIDKSPIFEEVLATYIQVQHPRTYKRRPIFSIDGALSSRELERQTLSRKPCEVLHGWEKKTTFAVGY
jgi:hypothetical protein